MGVTARPRPPRGWSTPSATCSRWPPTATAAGPGQPARRAGRRGEHRRGRHLGARARPDRAAARSAGPRGCPIPTRRPTGSAAAFAALDPTGAMAAECLADYAAKIELLAAAGDPLAALRTAGTDCDAALGRLLTEPGGARRRAARGRAAGPVRRPARAGRRRAGPVGGRQLRAAAAALRRGRPRHAARRLGGRRRGRRCWRRAEHGARPGPRRDAAAAGWHRPRHRAPAAPPRVFAATSLDLDGTVYLGDEPLPGAVGDARADPRGRLAPGLPDQQPAARRRPSYAERLPASACRPTSGDVVTPLGVLTGYLAERHPGRGRAHRCRAAGRRDAGRGRDQVTTRAGRGRGGRRLVRPDLQLRQAAPGAPRRPAARRGDRGHQPRPVLPDPGRRAAGLRRDARRRRGVHRRRAPRPSRQAERAHGRPSCCARLGSRAGEAAMVGDRISTDVAMSRALGMTSVLVLSGATAAGDLAALAVAARLRHRRHRRPAARQADSPGRCPARPTGARSDRVRVHADPPRPHGRQRPTGGLRTDPRLRPALRRL